MKLNARSEKNLQGVHKDLVQVVRLAASIYDGPGEFVVIEGLRTLARQKELKAKGFSKTLNSRHITGHAVDIIPYFDHDSDGDIDDKDMWGEHNFKPIAKAMKAAADRLGVPLEWGGDWKNSWDKPHWQLPWRDYPHSNRGKTAELGDPIEEETTSGFNTKQMVASAGVGTAGLGFIADTLSSQQSNLTSGNVVSLIIGAIIVGLALYQAYKTWSS